MDEIAFVSLFLDAALRCPDEIEASAILTDYVQPTLWFKDVLSMFNDWQNAAARDAGTLNWKKAPDDESKIITAIEASFISQSEILVSTGPSTSVEVIPNPHGVRAAALIQVTERGLATLVVEKMLTNRFCEVNVDMDHMGDHDGGARFVVSGFLFVEKLKIESHLKPNPLGRIATSITSVLRIGETKEGLKFRAHSSSGWALSQLASEFENDW
jgi:hypothetical protein